MKRNLFLFGACVCATIAAVNTFAISTDYVVGQLHDDFDWKRELLRLAVTALLWFLSLKSAERAK